MPIETNYRLSAYMQAPKLVYSNIVSMVMVLDQHKVQDQELTNPSGHRMACHYKHYSAYGAL
jgi:hypothetical protein